MIDLIEAGRHYKSAYGFLPASLLCWFVSDQTLPYCPVFHLKIQNTNSPQTPFTTKVSHNDNWNIKRFFSLAKNRDIFIYILIYLIKKNIGLSPHDWLKNALVWI